NGMPPELAQSPDRPHASGLTIKESPTRAGLSLLRRNMEGGATAGDDRKRSNDPLEREPMNMNPLSARQSTVFGLAWKRYARQTPLRDVAPALNGRASLAGVRPCRTGAASFMVARARGRARRRA